MHDAGYFLVQVGANRLHGLVVRVQTGTTAGQDEGRQVTVLLTFGHQGVEVLDNIAVFNDHGIRGVETARAQPLHSDGAGLILVHAAGCTGGGDNNQAGEVLGHGVVFATHWNSFSVSIR